MDGLSCQRNPVKGTYRCHNSNRDDDHGKKVFAFHSQDYCVKTDLDHEWIATHKEANFLNPNQTLLSSPHDGFVLQNDTTNQPDNGVETRTDDETMSFYNERDIGFYYSLAETFAINDRYFSSVLGPTFPNRSYLMAATSFGHLTSDETVPDISLAPFLFYVPITGTIFDLLDANGVSWADYFSDVPQGVSFRNFLFDPFHFRPYSKPVPPELPFPPNPNNSFLEDAQAGTLPAVAFVDAAEGFFNPAAESDEHPLSDIRKGQSFVAQGVSAVRNGPNWNDSIIFIVYDEHGGFYDHIPSPAAAQGGAPNPDGSEPGQCADLSNPMASEQPGRGLACTESGQIETSFCPGFTPTGAFPAACADFDQLGIRVPFIAVSPFSKPRYVSHTVGDHTSMLALIERRFLSGGGALHLTARDAHANTLEDLFDFDHSPSLNAQVDASLAVPASSSDPGCGP